MKDYNDRVYELAEANGCNPFWYDGMLGWAWHCGCADDRHQCDQQCSMITLESAACHSTKL